jgi:hypothetical protein
MRLPGYSIAFLLAVLLVGTTPVGTGTGVHQLDLIHPLFSHVHIVDGRVVTHEDLAQGLAKRPTAAPSFGAGGSAESSGMGVSPTLPVQAIAPHQMLPTSWQIEDLDLPPSLEEAPPDPPPLPKS